MKSSHNIQKRQSSNNKISEKGVIAVVIDIPIVIQDTWFKHVNIHFTYIHDKYMTLNDIYISVLKKPVVLGLPCYYFYAFGLHHFLSMMQSSTPSQQSPKSNE